MRLQRLILLVAAALVYSLHVARWTVAEEQIISPSSNDHIDNDADDVNVILDDQDDDQDDQTHKDDPVAEFDETDIEISEDLEHEHDLSRKHKAFTPDEKILFLSNFTKCKMFYKKCSIRVIIADLSLFSTLKVKSSDRKIMDFARIESCNFSTTSSLTASSSSLSSSAISMLNHTINECLAIERLNTNKDYTYKNYFLIRLKPKLVGIKYMEFSYSSLSEYDNSSSSSIGLSVSTVRHKLVVTSPDRLIDTIQIVYVLFFSIVIAIVMGILIDLETLVKIIKMPVAVMIGFISQYLFMPLVSSRICFLFFILDSL